MSTLSEQYKREAAEREAAAKTQTTETTKTTPKVTVKE